MEKYISLLRGINVSGKNKIKMVELKKVLENERLSNVITYIQSGNIVFDFKKSDNKKLELKIKKAIENNFGLDVQTLVLNVDDLNKVYSNNPFLIERNEDINFLHATILDQVPDEELVNQIKDFKSDSDEFIVYENIIYLFCPNGSARTKLTNNFFEKKLKSVATTRNWKTITKLVELSK